MELSGFNIKKFIKFSQKKDFVIFQETETPKKLLTFQKTDFSYILGNGNPKKLFVFQEVTFLFFGKWNSFSQKDVIKLHLKKLEARATCIIYWLLKHPVF